jgi:hypothetical protein
MKDLKEFFDGINGHATTPVENNVSPFFSPSYNP